MPIDQTPYFKARTKTLCQRLKKSASPVEDHLRDEASVPTPAMSAYKNLVCMALAISKGIHEFSYLLWTQRKDYLAYNSLINSMSNEERDRFDQDSEKTLRQLEATIQKLNGRVKVDELLSAEQKQHLGFVAQFLDFELKKIVKVVTRMRVLRVKGQAARLSNMRLSTLVKGRSEKVSDSPISELNTGIRRRLRQDDNVDYGFAAASKELKTKGITSDSDEELDTRISRGKHDKKKPSSAHFIDEVLEKKDPFMEVESNLLPEEKAQLSIECEKIYDKFSHVNVEINSLETQLAEIQHLQDTLAEKILNQEKDIELINETAIHTTENLKDGNEWIRQAISNSAGRRVVVLFCIIVITFTLLFLDWYNP